MCPAAVQALNATQLPAEWKAILDAHPRNELASGFRKLKLPAIKVSTEERWPTVLVYEWKGGLLIATKRVFWALLAGLSAIGLAGLGYLLLQWGFHK